jgi:hypothetical protein
MADSAKYNPKSSMTAELNRLAQEISAFAYNATEEQKEALLPLLKSGKIREVLKTWQQAEIRKAPRKPCALTIYYTVEDQVLEGTMQDISTGGVFMDSFAPVHVGQEIRMTFWPANHEEPMEIDGEIAHIASEGVGIKFKTPPTKQLKALIKSL